MITTEAKKLKCEIFQRQGDQKYSSVSTTPRLRDLQTINSANPSSTTHSNQLIFHSSPLIFTYKIL